jgi:hypothetical protein
MSSYDNLASSQSAKNYVWLRIEICGPSHINFLGRFSTMGGESDRPIKSSFLKATLLSQLFQKFGFSLGIDHALRI